MSTKSVHVNTENSPNVKKSVTVIIRAHGNEPVRLRAVRFDARTVEVSGSDPDQSISFPIQWVYSDNEETYKKLLAAYENGDTERLLTLWKMAVRFNGETR